MCIKKIYVKQKINHKKWEHSINTCIEQEEYKAELIKIRNTESDFCYDPHNPEEERHMKRLYSDKHILQALQ
jgi:hypothetical protein